MPSISGVSELQAALNRLVAGADAATRAIVAEAAAEVETAVKSEFDGAHPAGQPHVGGDRPNVVTGNLRRSIRTDPIRRAGLGVYATRVYPTAVYSRRVELGFDGADSLGRIYHQRPYPYFKPGVDRALAKVPDIAGRRWAAALH